MQANVGFIISVMSCFLQKRTAKSSVFFLIFMFITDFSKFGSIVFFALGSDLWFFPLSNWGLIQVHHPSVCFKQITSWLKNHFYFSLETPLSPKTQLNSSPKPKNRIVAYCIQYVCWEHLFVFLYFFRTLLSPFFLPRSKPLQRFLSKWNFETASHSLSEFAGKNGTLPSS